MVGKRLTDKRESDLANQALHQTPDTWAVPARAGGGAGEHKHTISWNGKDSKGSKHRQRGLLLSTECWRSDRN